MVMARSNQQQSFADRVPTVTVTFEQQAADHFATRRPSRLARLAYRDPGPVERCRQQADLGRLSAPLAPLDSDEPTPACRHVSADCPTPDSRRGWRYAPAGPSG